ADHEVYRVCDDVYEIVGKMLRVNEAMVPSHGTPDSTFKRFASFWSSWVHQSARPTRKTIQSPTSGYRKAECVSHGVPRLDAGPPDSARSLRVYDALW